MLDRSLVGETLALDLVNTQWPERGEMVDFLADPDGVALWLREHGFDPDTDEVLPLLSARTAIRGFLEEPGPAADARLNAVLAHGGERPVLREGSPVNETSTDAGWGAAWSAARSFVQIVGTQPDRLRQCAHPDCVLYFFDTSRNGTRRWHSMETCGARAKSARYYRRSQVESIPTSVLGAGIEGESS